MSSPPSEWRRPSRPDQSVVSLRSNIPFTSNNLVITAVKSFIFSLRTAACSHLSHPPYTCRRKAA
nr:TPA_asm: M52 uORF RNA *2 [Murid betaherpesvirus 1]DBA07793.1 TPA_asm: M52 uORF RNA *2 [Murid betaherpesvirus 1]